MSRGFIGLDNPALRGNVRTYRRRPIQTSQRQQVRPLGLLDDVSDNSIGTHATRVEVTPTIASKPTIKNQNTPTVSISKPIQKNVEQRPPEKLPVIQEPAPKIAQSKKRLLNLPKINRKDIFTMKFALPSMAVIIFLIGCGVALQGILTNRHVKAQVSNSVGSTDEGGGIESYDEADPEASGGSGSYTVPAHMPKYIRINKIGITKRVVGVGVKGNNEMATPNNIHTVGWYTGSSMPGTNGAALMAAHVHGPTMPGAFYKIDKLTAGDNIEVEMGDGRKFNYSVVSSEKQPYSNVDMNKAMRSIESNKPGLNLITCAGKYNQSTKMYEERIIVYAAQK